MGEGERRRARGLAFYLQAGKKEGDDDAAGNSSGGERRDQHSGKPGSGTRLDLCQCPSSPHSVPGPIAAVRRPRQLPIHARRQPSCCFIQTAGRHALDAPPQHRQFIAGCNRNGIATSPLPWPSVPGGRAEAQVWRRSPQMEQSGAARLTTSHKLGCQRNGDITLPSAA